MVSKIETVSSRTCKVATFNTNSIRSRLKVLLDWLHREKPDILCLQETKVQDADFPAASIADAGYHVVFKGRKAHASYGCDDIPDILHGPFTYRWIDVSGLR